MRRIPSIPGPLALAILALGAGLACPEASAKVFLDQKAALVLAFGEDARVERKSIFLSDAQIERARELAGKGVEVESALVTRYTGRSGAGALLGTAYFDSHRVRTLPETVMIVVSPAGSVARVEILAFNEPEEYKPRPAWLEQVRGRALDRELALRRGVHGITGATLSAEAVTAAVRRVLAIHGALSEAGDSR
jgi:hypothetical protein